MSRFSGLSRVAAFGRRTTQRYRGGVTAPVVLVHGWGGSFATTWQRSGFTELLRDAGRDVIGVDLLGHGAAPKPHDPDEYADLGARVLEAVPDGSQIDARLDARLNAVVAAAFGDERASGTRADGGKDTE